MSIILRGTSPTPDLYNWALTWAYRFDFRMIDPDHGAQKEPEIWEKIKRDGKIAQVIQQRCAVVASKNWMVEPGGERDDDKELATLVEEALRKITRFREARKLLAMGIFRGRSYAFIEGRRRRARIGGMVARWWMPTQLRHVDKRRLTLLPENTPDGRVSLSRIMWSVNRGEYVKVDAHWDQMIEVVYQDEESRLGFGQGVLDALYFLWWAKSRVLQEGFQAIERWAQGFLVGKVDSEKPGDTASDSNDARDAMRDELEKHRSRHVAVVDKDDEIEMVTGGQEGYSIVRDFLDYIDNAILGAGMGSVLPFGGGLDKGSLARAEVEDDVSEELLDSDRGIMDEPVTEKLIKKWVVMNRPTLASIGLGEAEMPRFKTAHVKRENPVDNAPVIDIMLRAGVPLVKQEVYDKVGMTMPDEKQEVFDSETLPKPEPAMAGFGGGPGGDV